MTSDSSYGRMLTRREYGGADAEETERDAASTDSDAVLPTSPPGLARLDRCQSSDSGTGRDAGKPRPVPAPALRGAHR